MAVIILTWNEFSGKPQDAGVVSGDDCEVLAFDSIEDANKWIDNNDSSVCNFTKIVELDT